jgi:hypothetical protein
MIRIYIQRYKKLKSCVFYFSLKEGGTKEMQKEILEELKELRETTEFIINNEKNIENKHIEDYLRNFERIRYNIFNKIKLKGKYQVDENEKINYLNNRYKAEVENGILKIYIPETIPKYKNINNFAYKNIMLNVMEQTKKYKNMFDNELVFVFIKISEQQKNFDIDNKYVKPIIDGLVLSKVIKDDNTNNMFYGVLGTTNMKKKPHTEVCVVKGKKALSWIQNML